MKKHTIAIVDDHLLFAQSLGTLINSFPDFEVAYYASHGEELIDKLASQGLPDIILLDINMPIMDGIKTMAWLQQHQPATPVLALSMEDNEEVVMQMLRHGAGGYLLKDIHPKELLKALQSVVDTGFYHSEIVSSAMDAEKAHKDNPDHITNRERQFLKLLCTEMTYKEIADSMNLSPKTIEGYRETLFNKLNVKNRIGLAIYAIKNDIYEV